MIDEFYCDIELIENIDLLADCISKEIGNQVISFDDFLNKQNQYHEPPIKHPKPIVETNDPLEHYIFDKMYNDYLRDNYNPKYSIYVRKIQEQNFFKQYESTKQGYIDYLAENSQVITPFLNRVNKLPISETNRQYHTYISGGTGTGKSEAIKSFIWHYLTRNTNNSIILLSSHSEICLEVAKFHLNIDNNRLVYINPSLDFSNFPCLNPFDIADKQNIDDYEADRYSEDFLSVFKEIMKGHIDADISIQMDNLLKSILPIFIKMENSSVYDLIEFLDPQPIEEKGEDKGKIKPHIQKYIDFANQNIGNEAKLSFINGQFLTDGNLRQTKIAITGRLRSVFSSSIMQRTMKGKRTIDFENLINHRKLIVLDFSSSDMPAEYNILGIFVIAMIKIIIFRRDKEDKTLAPCHFFIDEFHNFVTPSLKDILKECRKFKLFLTLAQQQVGADMDEGLFHAIMGNTGVKLTGFNEYASLNKIAKETESTTKNLQKHLKDVGYFSLWQRRNFYSEAISPIIRMPQNTLGDSQSMHEDQWQAVLQGQIERYYYSSTKSHPQPQTAQSSHRIGEDLKSYYKEKQ